MGDEGAGRAGGGPPLSRPSAQAAPVAVLTLAAGAMGAVNFAFGLLVAKLAGESAWSAVSPMLAAGTAGSFAGLGFEYATSRVLVGGGRQRAVAWWAAAVGAASAAAVAAAWALAGPASRFMRLGSAEPVVLSVALFCATVLAAFPSGLLVGQRRFTALAACGVGGSLGRIAMLWASGGGWVDRALVASIGGTVAGALAMTAAGWAGRRPAGARPAGRAQAQFGRYALGGSLAQLVLWATMVAPVVAARHFLPLRAAGELATVTFVASGLAYLAAPVATVFFPSMVVDRSRALVLRGVAISAGIVVAGAGVMIGLGPWLLALLYGTRQEHLSSLLALGGLGVLAQSTSSFLAWAALARGQGVRAVLAGCGASLPLVGLLALWHSSAGALLLAALPAVAALGLVSSFFRLAEAPGLSAAPAPRPPGPPAAPAGAPVPVSVGIMAYNEEGSVGEVVRRFLDEAPGLVRVAEVVVVASGCSDGTAAAARAAGMGDPRLRVLEEPERRGKLAAVSGFLEGAQCEIAVVSGADTLPDPGALQELCRPLLADPGVGMAGPRVVPLPGRRGAQRLHRVLWELHHRVAAEAPKLGEVVAIRHRGCRLRAVAGCDEVVMEHAVSEAGMRLAYAPEAIVRNRGPESLGDYLRWRRRLAVQHACAARHGMRASTMSTGRCLSAAVALALDEPGALAALVACAAIEALARLGGAWAARRGEGLLLWEPTRSSRRQALTQP